LDPLHRRLAWRERAALDQDARDRSEWLAVLVRVPQAQDAALGESHPAGALDLQEERFDGVVDEDERLALERRLAVFDVGARPVGDDALAVDAAAHPLVLELRIDLAQVDGQQVVGWREQRITVLLGTNAASVEKRLVVAGDEAARRAIR